MGYRIESYSLNELHRIALPGAVAPSLFWVLPIGNWHQGELDRVWRWFTEKESACNDYGLLLVKDGGRRESSDSEVSLASVGARLGDIMPLGAERFVRPSTFREDFGRLLVLSGGYPQPGWGVLVECHEDVHFFEQLIHSVNVKLEDNGRFAAALRVFGKAKESFHCWRDLRGAPTRPDIAALEREILDAEKTDTLLREARNKLDGGEHILAGQKLSEVVRAIQQAAWLKIPEQDLSLLLDDQQTLKNAASILAVPADILAAEVEPKLDALIANPSDRKSAFKSLSGQQVKYALTACLYLREKGGIGAGVTFQSWAQKTLSDVAARLDAKLAGMERDITSQLTERCGVKARLEREYQLTMEEWRQSAGAARDAFHQWVARATEVQWDFGPRFLVAFEDVCREAGLWVRSIPWDPARMVGWKIIARQVSLDTRDLQIAAQEFLPGALHNGLENDQQTGLADGSYFTDYVHHIALSKPGVSAWTVTRDLVARLLRPAEMERLIQSH